MTQKTLNFTELIQSLLNERFAFENKLRELTVQNQHLTTKNKHLTIEIQSLKNQIQTNEKYNQLLTQLNNSNNGESINCNSLKNDSNSHIESIVIDNTSSNSLHKVETEKPNIIDNADKINQYIDSTQQLSSNVIENHIYDEENESDKTKFTNDNDDDNATVNSYVKSVNSEKLSRRNVTTDVDEKIRQHFIECIENGNCKCGKKRDYRTAPFSLENLSSFKRHMTLHVKKFGDTSIHKPYC